MRAMLAVLGLFVAAQTAHGAAGERIYRWTGEDGKTHFGDQPPRDGRVIETVESKLGTSPALSPTPSAPVRVASESECTNKRAQLSTYQNATRLVERDSLGREREFTAEEREQLVKKTQQELETQCGKAAP